MKYNISYDIAAIILSVGLLIFYMSKRSVMTKQRRVFEALLWISLISDVLDIITAVINNEGYNPVLIYSLNTAYLLLINSLPILYYIYFMLNIKNFRHWNIIEKVLLFLPYVPIMLMLLSTPWTKVIYEYTVDVGYRHAPLFSILFVQAFIYMLVSFAVTVIYRKRFSLSHKIALCFYGVGTLVALIIQINSPEQLVLQYGVSLALVLLFLAIENFSYDEDTRYGVYNREAFIKKMTYLTENGEKFSVIGMNIKGHQGIRETLGVFSARLFNKKIISLIKKIAKGTELYIISDEQYVLISGFDNQENEKIEYYLWKEFKEPVEYETNDIMFDMSMFRVDCPADAGTEEEIIDIIEMAEKETFDNEDGRVPHAGKSLLEKKRRENLVFQAMQKAIHNKTFKVYYQPIFDVNESYFHSAEALIRLIDEDLGYISPEEFIPLAERKGLILQIGDFVFEQVCKDMSERDFDNYRIRFIEINLSAVQCMQKNLKNRLVDIMNKYSIRPEQIDLEITETAMVSSGDMLLKNMRILTESGSTFAMDDFGTGFSNLSAMIQYPFHIVKLDKSMVWSAMNDERAMSVLRHSVAMLKDLSIRIVAEGVETMEQANILSRMGCDYLQGYYYSKPVALDDFMEIVKKMNT